ncbi:MAG: cysteine hydrolase family protein [Rhodospirillales bacterium]|nr:cysteine hydrolase family protein [Rhodospirillales bacterium]
MTTIVCDDQRSFEFDPSQTALIVIDYQRDFLEPEGGCSGYDEGSQRLAKVIPMAKSVLEAARKADLQIIHTRESYRLDMTDVSPLKREKGYVGKEGPLGRCLLRGEPGCDIISDMAPMTHEPVVDKPGFSAFFETDLQHILKNQDIACLVIIGITYQCCVHSTLRDAVDRGFRCLTLDDCCAALSPDLEEATRAIMRSEGNLFGWISDSRTFCEAVA